MYARVIVDVPAKPVNRAFDYHIPETLRSWVDVGSRVSVPFGPRTIMGFVVGLSEQTDLQSAQKIRDIIEVLDLSPPLTPELVQLANWLSRKYICHEILALQAMIPGALKARYEKCIIVSEENAGSESLPEMMFTEELDIIEFVRQRNRVPTEIVLQHFPDSGTYIKQLLKRGLLREVHQVKDRGAPRKVLTVFPPSDVEQLRSALQQLPEQAVRQKEVLEYLLQHPEPIKLAELSTQLAVSSQTVRGLADKGFIELKYTEVSRDPYAGRHFADSRPLGLTEEQRQVFQPVRDSLQASKHRVFLLHGVTGSGKTEVYLQSISQCLEKGREAIVLVPEISLTPQMVERFKGRFGDQVAVLHSALSQGERFDEWRKIINQQVKVVIGARSAIFAPFTKLGLIIIDEEHETSYKQEDSPKYHARDVAIQRGIMNEAVVILGSATPALESYQMIAADNGDQFQLLTMASRVQDRPLPPVYVVDMRTELKEGNRSMFSRPLYAAIEDRLKKKEQMVLLLNRRGYATFVMCRDCGHVIRCEHCDISLTYHQHSRNLRCHYCGYTEREAKTCPECSSEHIRHFGTGTQRVEEELTRLFPGIRIVRMDVDTTSTKGAHEKWLTIFRNRQADVLLGTQMVAKGLDFPYVTLVGVIAADTVLNLPDFRAAEKTFQLLTQVAGRAGRHELPGEVFVQTYNPEHYSIINASQHDYSGFIQTELETRRMRDYPPYHKIILLTLSHEQLPLLVRSAELLASRLRESATHVQSQHNKIEIFGPIASPIPRIKDRYRFQCMVKYQDDTIATMIVKQALRAMEPIERQDKVQISVDVDPQMLL